MRDVGAAAMPPPDDRQGGEQTTIEVRPAAASAPGYVILEHGVPIGWVRASTLGFGGYASAAEASHAAARATPELLSWYRTRWLGEPIPWLEPIEESRRVTCEGEVVGRMLHPADPSSPASEGFGFELRIPTSLWIGTCEALCRRLVRVMRGNAASADLRERGAGGGRYLSSR